MNRHSFLRKQTVLTLLMFFSSLSLLAQNKQISIHVENASLKEVFQEIEKQTEYRFSYLKHLIDTRKDITMSKDRVSVNQVLDIAFRGRNLSYDIISPKSIVIVEKKQPAKQGTVSRKITGLVVDNAGEPIIGATVLVAGTSNGALSALDGSWSLSVTDTDKELKVSYVGYVSRNIAIGTKSNFKVTLSEDVATLDEVIVVGYGMQKKSVMTAAISSVKGEQLSVVAPTRMDNALKGMVSGVSITSSSGQPGDGTRIRIRGTGTINDSDPLYIVDGMPVTGGIEYINPADIESIEVLKDAASAAIYGSRGANGVILVSTKKGSEGCVTVSYDFSYGIQSPWRKLEMLNATEYATLINEMNMNDGKQPTYDNPLSLGKGTNWQNEIFSNNAPIVNHQLSVSGGNNRINYYFSAGYLYQEGIIGGNLNHSNYERITLRSNNNYVLFDAEESRSWLKSLKMGTNISYSHDLSRSITSNGERGTVLGSALALSPIMNVYASDPEELLASHPNAVTDAHGRPFAIAGDEFAMMPNPVALLHQPIDANKSDKIVANIFAELELYKNLKFKSSFSGDLSFYTNDGYILPYYLNSNKQNESSSVWSTLSRGFSWQVENTLSYKFSVDNKHNISLLLGQSASSYNDQYVSGTSYQIRDASQPWIDATDQDAKMRSADGSISPYSRLASYFTRIGYDFDERYMLEFTIRRDGSSNFSPENKWANFPSVSAGWNITNEAFMNNRPDFLTSLKLRASWGRNGNQNIRSFGYTSMMKGGADYLLGVDGSTAIVPGSVPQGYANSALKWEESEQTDIGIDMRMFNGRLGVTLDWYNKRTNGMLMEMALPGYIGNERPIGNVGDMENRGFEFDITFKTKISNVALNIGFNGSYNRNKLVKLGNETGTQNYDEILGTLGVVSRAENGKPFPFFYGWKTAGIFQTEEQVNSYVNSKGELLQPNAVPGDVIFVDVNRDGIVDDGDRTKLGKGMPDWNFGFNVGMEWKGLDVNALFHATVGNDIYDATRRADYPMVNMPRYMLDRWCGPNSSNHLPRLTSQANGGPNQNWRSSDLFVHDGSFLRLRSIQVGYTLPKELTSKLFMNRLRVYLGAENLFTLTRYHGFDPEISSGGTSLGIDKGVYPQPRTFTIGANVTF